MYVLAISNGISSKDIKTDGRTDNFFLDCQLNHHKNFIQIIMNPMNKVLFYAKLKMFDFITP